MENPPNYSEYLALSDQEKERVGRPIMTLAWIDPEEVALLSNQSWLNQIREQLNRGGKFTLNLGAFKYEQAGLAEKNDSRQAIELTQKLFLKTVPLTVMAFQGLLEESLRKAEHGFFEPSLLVVDGEVALPWDAKWAIDGFFKLVASHLGYSVSGTLASHLRPYEDELSKQMFSMVASLRGEKAAYDYLTNNFEPVQHAIRTVFNGKTYAVGDVLGLHASGEKERRFKVYMPTGSLDSFSRQTLNGRVLGWLECAGYEGFFVRAIAVARVDIFAPF